MMAIEAGEGTVAGPAADNNNITTMSVPHYRLGRAYVTVNNGRLFGTHVMKSTIINNNNNNDSPTNAAAASSDDNDDNDNDDDDDDNDDIGRAARTPSGPVFLNTDRIYLWFAHMAPAHMVYRAYSAYRRNLPNSGVLLLEGLVAERLFETCSQNLGCMTFRCSPQRRDCILARGYVTLQNVRDREVGVYWFTKMCAMGLKVRTAEDAETIDWKDIFMACKASWTIAGSESRTVCYGSQFVLVDNCQFTGRLINWCRQLSIWNIVEKERAEERRRKRNENNDKDASDDDAHVPPISTTRTMRTDELIWAFVHIACRWGIEGSNNTPSSVSLYASCFRSV